MILSIITGTYQRLDYLRAMVESVRNQMPVGFDYEFVIVDGGSTDGTPEWCAQQADIHFIQQGELLGAIRAFDAGCRAAQGDYVLLLNDDVLVVDGSIVKALSYLDGHPDCGAVAFMDNRRAPGYDTDAYKVQTIRAVRAGALVDVPYAQCGLFRRWLGDLCGWWGSEDTDWGESHTYGGDSRLSAEIWRRGYTVDAVPGVAVNDRVAPDVLRQRNHQQEQRIGSAYYRKYPNGVAISALPKPDDPMGEHLRILYLPLFSPRFGRYKRGLCDALAKVGVVYELDYVRQRERFVGAVADFQPHLILAQFHDAHTITPEALRYVRTLAPSAVVVNWCGDVYQESQTAPDMLDLLHSVDLALVVNADLLPIYKAEGIRAAYWQIGYEPVPEPLPMEREHDLVFMANAYSASRKELATVLRGISQNTGLYGYGWDELGGSGNTFYNFARGAALYRRCKIAIGDNQYGDKGFVSNRLFEALANGAFLLHQHVPGLRDLTGIEPGVHLVEWSDDDDLTEKAHYYLAHEDERRQIAAAGEAFVRQHCSFDARVRELFDLLGEPVEEHGRAEPVGSTEEMAWMD